MGTPSNPSVEISFKSNYLSNLGDTTNIFLFLNSSGLSNNERFLNSSGVLSFSGDRFSNLVEYRGQGELDFLVVDTVNNVQSQVETYGFVGPTASYIDITDFDVVFGPPDVNDLVTATIKFKSAYLSALDGQLDSVWLYYNTSVDEINVKMIIGSLTIEPNDYFQSVFQYYDNLIGTHEIFFIVSNDDTLDKSAFQAISI
jgi:hypothetical protein